MLEKMPEARIELTTFALRMPCSQQLTTSHINQPTDIQNDMTIE
jgi:hypothetical protein